MKFDPVTLILHAIFGIFLSAVLWFFGLGGMSAWFRGHPTGWIETKAGGFVVILIGAVVGVIAGIFRDRQIFRVDQDEALGMRIGFKTFVKIGLPLALGLFIIWSLLR